MMDPVSAMLLGGATLGGLNATLGVGASAVDAALQYHYAKKMYQHRYQWAMKDMAKAGLNPVLAANGGNVSGMGSAPSTDFAGAVNSGVSSALSAARAVSDIHAQSVSNSKTEADQKLAEANTNNVNARTQWQTIQNGILTKTEKALVKDAQARAVTNNALATLQKARAMYADSLSESEANHKSIQWQQQREDFKSKPPHFYRRQLWYQQELAKRDLLRSQAGSTGWNTASRVLGAVARFLK